MSRPASKPLPPPLPPETRTVGQLVAETLKLYGDHLWTSLALGLSVTLINQVSAGHETVFQVLVLTAGAPLMAASFVGASAIVGGVRPPRPMRRARSSSVRSSSSPRRSSRSSSCCPRSPGSLSSAWSCPCS